jgi:hypothetical protein
MREKRNVSLLLVGKTDERWLFEDNIKNDFKAVGLEG